MRSVKPKVTKTLLSGMMILLLTLSLAAAPSTTASAKVKEPVFPIVEGMQQISDDVFVSTGDYLKVNLGLVVSGNEAVVIDTGIYYPDYGLLGDEALRIKEYIEKNNLTLTKILLTHRHIDHAGNLSMFGDVEVLDPYNTTDGQLISFGDKTFRVIRTNGHINDEHISIELLEEDILFAGDVVVTNLPSAVAFDGNFKGLVPTLQMLRTKNYSIIVPGHGDIINSHEAINMQLEYLKNVEKYVGRIIDDGGTVDDVLKIKLEDCMRNLDILDPVDTQTVHEMSLVLAYTELTNEK
jgi:glyoxylase-like metal-dependent hydrolase (beta-lactamase superfamily II)